LTDVQRLVLAEPSFRAPRKFADLTDRELEQFAGVFLPGGHAPMQDLKDNAELGRILGFFHDRQKTTGE